MCWVALDRLLQLHRAGFIARLPADEFERERDAIRAEVERDGFNAALDSYTQRARRRHASTPACCCSAATATRRRGDARMRGTLPARSWSGCARRPASSTATRPARPQAEGAFGICSAWVTEHLAERRRLAGRGGGLVPAVPRLRQRPGPLAEEIDPATGAALGNFPQAYSHVGLISAALAIEARRRAELDAAPRKRAAAPARKRPRMNWTSWLVWGFAATAVLTTLMAGSEGSGSRA